MPIMLSPMPMNIAPPTALISETTSVLRMGAKAPASNISSPSHIRTGTSDSTTPMPIAADIAAAATPSIAVFVNSTL